MDIQYKSVTKFRNKRIAIDSPSLFFRFFSVSKKVKNIDYWKILLDKFLENFINCKLIFIKEGRDKPVEKQETLDMRRDVEIQLQASIQETEKKLKKEPFNPVVIAEYDRLLASSKDDYFRIECEMIEYLHKKGIEIIISDGEAERTASRMCRNGEVDFVYSTDTDVFAHLTPAVILGKEKKYFKVYILSEILEKLKLTEGDFQNLLIMSGTDYNKGMSTALAYNKIQKQEVSNFPNLEKLRMLFS